MKTSLITAVPLAAALSLQAQGTLIYSESISGDLSGAFAAPTPIVLATGTNTVRAQIGNNGNTGATNGQDADYLTVNIGPGQQLSSLRVDSYTFSPSNPNVSFAAYTVGAAFGGQGFGNISGQVLFNASSGEILDDLAGGPLGPGAYSFWFQETSANIVNYEVSFAVVPEPATGTTLALALGLGWVLRRGRTLGQ